MHSRAQLVLPAPLCPQWARLHAPSARSECSAPPVQRRPCSVAKAPTTAILAPAARANACRAAPELCRSPSAQLPAQRARPCRPARSAARAQTCPSHAQRAPTLRSAARPLRPATRVPQGHTRRQSARQARSRAPRAHRGHSAPLRALAPRESAPLAHSRETLRRCPARAVDAASTPAFKGAQRRATCAPLVRRAARKHHQRPRCVPSAPFRARRAQPRA